MLGLRITAFSPLAALLIAVPAGIRDSAPVVGLNHLTLVPDSATFAAIAASPFLRDTFALLAQPPGEGAATEGVAILGRSTYVEFRRPGAGGVVGSSGLALGTDERGALRAVARRLTSEVGSVRLDSLMRRRDSTDVPWVYQLVAGDARLDSALAVRVVEYHPSFLRKWYGAAPAASTSVARTRVLELHATSADSVKRRYPFVDVVAIKVAAPTETEPVLLAHCRAVGWRVQSTNSGTACVGSGVRLFVVPANTRERGIVAFTMRIASTGKLRGATTRKFGRSTLRISRNGFATWEFVN
ncbi:MAG TPA: DUF5829 family protein [Gemmatimonadaceae bacterium]|nr:DUF5829 family protein [Gemmatimonadaceae bacterium]